MGTGFAYLIYHGLQRDAGATFTSMVTYLSPIVAVALGVVILDEAVVWNLFVGALIIIAGVIWNLRAESARAKPA
jgi:drug/metabolite transporter (DMT)-like permease